MTLAYRVLGPDDAECLQNIEAGVFDDPIVESSTVAFLNNPLHHLVVASDDDTIVGFVSAIHYFHPDEPAPELWINEIGVSPHYRRRGIGRRLIEILLDLARSIGCREAWVLTDSANLPARELYLSAGGRESRRQSALVSFDL